MANCNELPPLSFKGLNTRGVTQYGISSPDEFLVNFSNNVFTGCMMYNFQ